MRIVLILSFLIFCTNLSATPVRGRMTFGHFDNITIGDTKQPLYRINGYIKNSADLSDFSDVKVFDSHGDQIENNGKISYQENKSLMLLDKHFILAGITCSGSIRYIAFKNPDIQETTLSTLIVDDHNSVGKISINRTLVGNYVASNDLQFGDLKIHGSNNSRTIITPAFSFSDIRKRTYEFSMIFNSLRIAGIITTYYADNTEPVSDILLDIHREIDKKDIDPSNPENNPDHWRDDYDTRNFIAFLELILREML